MPTNGSYEASETVLECGRCQPVERFQGNRQRTVEPARGRL